MPEFKRLAFDVESGGPGSGPQGGSMTPEEEWGRSIRKPAPKVRGYGGDGKPSWGDPAPSAIPPGKKNYKDPDYDINSAYPLGDRSSLEQAHLNALASTAAFPPDEHQMRICIDTLKNPMKGQFMGGPSAEEAEKILREKFQFGEGQIQKLKGGRGEPPNAFNRPAPKLR